MHQDILSRQEMSDFIPADQPLCRQYLPVVHDALMRGALFLVDKVADQEIQLRVLCREVPERVEYFIIALGVDPVIRIHDLKKDTARIPKTGHDRSAVAAVHLVNCPADGRILPLVAVRNLAGIILLRAVVDN